MSRLRIGIIGCGNVLSAYWPQAQRLAAEHRAEVVAACGRPAQREYVAQLGIPRFVTDHRALVSDPQVDAILVLTSSNSHFEIAREALLAGKHVVCEKPMATALDEAAELVELSRCRSPLYLPAPFTLLSPTYQRIAGHLRRDDIGRVCSARARYGWSGPSWNEWFYRPGGGPIFDLATYNITSLTGWLGPARRVMAMTGTAVKERMIEGRKIEPDVEDNVQLLMDFGNACFAVVTSGYVMQQYRSPAIELYGTQGTLQLLGDDWAPEGYELWQNSRGCWQVFPESDREWRWTDGLRHLVDCIERGGRPLVTAEHAYHVLEIMLQAQVSGRSGRECEIRSSFDPPRFTVTQPEEAAHLRHDRTRTAMTQPDGVGRRP
jgi:predicted dehydrogenase